jgi:hypothetical protein
MTFLPGSGPAFLDGPVVTLGDGVVVAIYG